MSNNDLPVLDAGRAITDIELRHGGRTTSDQGECARYVRRALEAGGVIVNSTLSAKDYGPQLERAGFESVAGSSLIKGDVVVIEPVQGGSPHGHMAIYDGWQWHSDFVQRDMYPNNRYRTGRPSYRIYRYKGEVR